MNIGGLDFAVPIFLAPMAGVTDSAFRRLCKTMNCPLCVTEMVSAKGIHYKSEKTLAMLSLNEDEGPTAVQLFGSEPDIVAEAARYIENLGTFDMIDFNMGCPAPKIVKNGEGAALMKNPRLAFDILRALASAVKIPVTVKMRKGFDEANANAVEIAKIAESAGVAAVTVHGRTREQYYSGRADWETIARVKDAVKIPVIGNGDVRSADDLDAMFRATNCDGVMIGRAAEGNPWIFRELSAYYRTKTKIPPPTLQERIDVMLRHLAMLVADKGEYVGIREMRRHAVCYTKGITGAARLREEINHAESREDFARIFSKLGKTDYLY